jgi:hypothetical protein
MKRSKTLTKRSGTVNGQERSGTLKNGERSSTMNGQEHIGTFESKRSYALERKVENGHGTVTLTHQKRKKHCIL